MKRPRGRGLKAGKRRGVRTFWDIEDLPLTVTVPELAEIMNCTRQHAWAMVKAGKIRTTAPLGRVIRIPRPEVIRIYRGELGTAAEVRRQPGSERLVFPE